jgi:hypothetical protein
MPTTAYRVPLFLGSNPFNHQGSAASIFIDSLERYFHLIQKVKIDDHRVQKGLA